MSSGGFIHPAVSSTRRFHPPSSFIHLAVSSNKRFPDSCPGDVMHTHVDMHTHASSDVVVAVESAETLSALLFSSSGPAVSPGGFKCWRAVSCFVSPRFSAVSGRRIGSQIVNRELVIAISSCSVPVPSSTKRGCTRYVVLS